MKSGLLVLWLLLSKFGILILLLIGEQVHLSSPLFLLFSHDLLLGLNDHSLLFSSLFLDGILLSLLLSLLGGGLISNFLLLLSFLDLLGSLLGLSSGLSLFGVILFVL